MGVRRIRRAVRQVRYEFTSHALDEMDDDGLTEEDVCAVLLRGSLVEELTDDARGVRFVICGSPELSDFSGGSGLPVSAVGFDAYNYRVCLRGVENEL